MITKPLQKWSKIPCKFNNQRDITPDIRTELLAGLLARYVIDEEDAHQMMYELCIGLARNAYTMESNQNVKPE